MLFGSKIKVGENKDSISNDSQPLTGKNVAQLS